MAVDAVVNASPIIRLARIDGLDRLRALGETVVVPDRIVEEVASKGAGDEAAARWSACSC